MHISCEIKRTDPPRPPIDLYTHTHVHADMRLLGQQAERAQAYAKCLKYKEREFHADPSPDCVEVCLHVHIYKL